MKIYNREKEVKNYKQASDFLAGKMKRKIAGNTWVEVRSNNEFAVRYYDTDIVTYKKDGSIILNNGGWKTVTTKERLSAFTPISVYQKNYEWFIGRIINDVFENQNIPFVNGMEVSQ